MFMNLLSCTEIKSLKQYQRKKIPEEVSAKINPFTDLQLKNHSPKVNDFFLFL